MNMHLKSSCMLGVLLLAYNVSPTHAQLTPVECGAVSTHVGSKLLFVNGTNLTAASGFVQPLIFQRVANRYGTNGYYATTNLMFTAVSMKTNTASAAVGSYVACEVGLGVRIHFPPAQSPLRTSYIIGERPGI